MENFRSAGSPEHDASAELFHEVSGAPRSSVGDATRTLLDNAESMVGKSLLNQPRDSQYRGSDVPPNLGCAATVSNLLMMSNPEFTGRDFQINVDKLESTLRRNLEAYRLSDSANPQPGDIVIGRDGRGGGRHVGILGPVENGQQMVFNNSGGQLAKEPLAKAFERYKTIYYLRVP